MYRIIKYTKKTNLNDFDYVLKKFSEFYDLTCYIYYPLFGVYNIAIVNSDIKETAKFIDLSRQYDHLEITIFMEEVQMERLSIIKPDAKFGRAVGGYEIWQGLVGKRGLLFDKYMMYKLYESIEHDTAAMTEALNLIQETYGSESLITRDKLEKLFVLNDIVYPRQVLLKFINMDYNRWKLLKICMNQMDSGVICGATVNNIKKFVEAKVNYFKTGEGQDYIKNLNTQNLIIAYKVFCSDRLGLDDPFILYKLYESGKSVKEVKGGSNVTI